MSALPGYDYWKTTDFAYEAAEVRAAEVDRRFAEYTKDPDKVAEADSYIEGALDYAGIETLLANLHTIQPSDLLGTDVLASLYRRANEAHTARMEQLRGMAEEDTHG